MCSNHATTKKKKIPNAASHSPQLGYLLRVSRPQASLSTAHEIRSLARAHVRAFSHHRFAFVPTEKKNDRLRRVTRFARPRRRPHAFAEAYNFLASQLLRSRREFWAKNRKKTARVSRLVLLRNHESGSIFVLLMFPPRGGKSSRLRFCTRRVHFLTTMFFSQREDWRVDTKIWYEVVFSIICGKLLVKFIIVLGSLERRTIQESIIIRYSVTAFKI